MLMEGAEHPQRHLIITHQHSAEIRRFAQHLQRAGVAALRIPVAVQDGHRLQTVTIRGLQPAFNRSLAETELSGPASRAISRCPIS